ncbi:hypothetical protein XENORESO_013970 [Xenotaenia resolanae]|uniref:Uncharacterized protein n=1 Tax=Xenotaenia resolanae TaxID=208358 RepID=A0ABV0WKA0_9TELE
MSTLTRLRSGICGQTTFDDYCQNVNSLQNKMCPESILHLLSQTEKSTALLTILFARERFLGASLRYKKIQPRTSPSTVQDSECFYQVKTLNWAICCTGWSEYFYIITKLS